MSVLCLNVCRLCVPNIMSLGICLTKLHLIKVGAFAWYSVKSRVIFGVRFERRKVDKKSKPTWKLKDANSIRGCWEHLDQIVLKSILIISSYTVSKLVRLLRHGVFCCKWLSLVRRVGRVGAALLVTAVWQASQWKVTKVNRVYRVYLDRCSLPRCMLQLSSLS